MRKTILLLALAACTKGEAPDAAAARDPQAQLMTRGLAELQAGDPATAERTFRELLATNPNHYGAHYQLAVALDRAGQRAAAKPYWEKTLGMAISVKDEKTAAVARERLKS